MRILRPPQLPTPETPAFGRTEVILSAGKAVEGLG